MSWKVNLMASAPAGWYKDANAPGGRRYWNGEAWLDPAPVAPVVTADFTPQAGVFMPSTTAQPTAEFLPTSAAPHAATPVHAEPSVQGTEVGPQPNAGHEDVPWNVVGTPRQPHTAPNEPATLPAWSPDAQQSYGSAPTNYGAAPTNYGASSGGYGSTQGGYASTPYMAPSPTLPPYGSSVVKRRSSGLTRTGVIIATVVIGFGVRWAFSMFSGADFSDDGRIEVTAPDSWTTYTVSNPDLTYAMDARWADLTSVAGPDISGNGVRVVTVRSITAATSGKEALLIMGTATSSAPVGEPNRSDFASAFDKTLGSINDLGGKAATVQKLRILKTDAGDRWGIQSATFPVSDTTMTIYQALSSIDGYVVVVQLFVPDGVALTQNDILAVVNSIKAR